MRMKKISALLGREKEEFYMKDKIMKGKMTKRVLSFILTLAMVFSLMPGNVEKVKAAEDVRTVGTLDELISALADDSIHRVIVSRTITLPNNTNLNGKEKTVQVEVPYLEESGATSASPSNYNVFTVASGATVTIRNMQIFGGKDANTAGGIVNKGTLTLENITIARSYRGLCIAGKSSKAVLKNTNIVRNQCRFGGGILCAGGTLVMDGCSLTENRSLDSSGGGGAMEINNSGTLYANNTVIANNSSSEIGGAINNYQSNVYLMNCQVIGNVTTKEATYGGGLGINGGKLKAVNSIFKDNYFIWNGTGTSKNGMLQVSDVGIYRGSGNELINCIYGKIQGSESAVNKTGCKVITEDNIFTNYRDDGVLYGSSNAYTTKFKHPALRAKDGNPYALYANPSVSGNVSGGVDTYFDYSDLANVKMSYGPADSMTPMTTNPEDALCKVTTYYEGGARKSGVIGASEVSDERFYTVKLGGVPSGGTVQGISIYGDSYAENTSATVSAIPNPGYVFTGWKNGETIVSPHAKYTFSVTENLNLTAEFTHTHSWNYKNGTGDDANKLYAYCSGASECPYAGSEGDVSQAVSLTLNAASTTHTGEAATASYGSGEAEAWKTATGAEAPTITYYRKDGETEIKTTSGNSGAAGEGQAPVNVGKYVAKITVSGATASKEFEIHQQGNGVKQNGKSATCTTDGFKDYYKCGGCDKLYKEAACTNEITDLTTWKTTDGQGKLAALGHDWRYNADGATLTATCNRDASHTATLTLSASSPNYSGTTVTYSDDGTDANIKLDGKTAWTGAGLSYEVKYYTSYTDEDNNTPTSSTNGGASEEGAAPKDAGDYIVVLKAKEGDVVKKTLEKSFSINAVTITSDFIILEAASKEYTGAEITNAVTVKDGSTTLAVDTDYTVTGNKGTAKGEYTVSVTGKGNYKGTATKKWNITGAIPTITTNPTAGTITYGQKLSDSTLTGGVAKKGETVVPGTFAWKTPDVTPKVSDSGSTNYKIVFTPTDTESYGTVEFDAKVMVNKKTLTAKILNQTALKTADATYAITKDMIVLGAILDEDKGKVEVDTITGGNNPSIATAGTYDITATGLTLSGDASANYQVTSVTNGTLTVKEPTGGVQINNNTDSGSVFVEVNKEDELPTTSISNMDKELASALLNDTDETNVTGGQNALIYLDLKDGENLASAEEISKIETAVTAGENKGALLDLSLYKKIGGAAAEKITDIRSTSKKVEVSIQVSDLGLPALAAGYTRTYSIIRLHGTTAERLNVTVVNGEIKFATDKFSLYQILYKDASNGGGGNTPGGGGGYNPTVLATEVKIDTPSKTELTEKGETLQLTASITPSNTTNKTLTWKSSDEAVVTVDSTGKVTAVGDGTATITVSTSNGKTTTIEITVKIRKDNDEEKPSEDKPSDPITATEIAKNTLTLNAGLKVSQTGKKINVVWGKVADADGYLVYATYCGTNFGSAIKTIKNPTTTSLSITKLNGKAIDLKKSVKVYVKAYKLVDGKKVAFGKTITAHIVGSKNTKYTNVKEIKLTSKSSVTLAVGKTSTIKAKVVLVDAKKKQLSDAHTKEFRYVTSNKKVATVSSEGKIKAVGKGTCTIYVYARNGYAKKVKVTVK